MFIYTVKWYFCGIQIKSKEMPTEPKTSWILLEKHWVFNIYYKTFLILATDYHWDTVSRKT